MPKTNVECDGTIEENETIFITAKATPRISSWSHSHHRDKSGHGYWAPISDLAAKGQRPLPCWWSPSPGESGPNLRGHEALTSIDELDENEAYFWSLGNGSCPTLANLLNFSPNQLHPYFVRKQQLFHSSPPFSHLPLHFPKSNFRFAQKISSNKQLDLSLRHAFVSLDLL